MATVHQFHLPIQDEETLRAFVEHAFGAHIPDEQVCEGHSTPWRAFADAYFAREPVTVWKASRGFGGKSYLLALLGLTEACTLKAGVSILGGSGEQSENAHAYTTQFWDFDQAPTALLASDPFKRETRLIWGNRIRALTASQKSVRGPHPQRLRLDEVDEMEIEILDASLGQPMSKSGVEAQTVISSTHQHPDGTMTKVLERAADRGWPVYEWCYRENMEPHGWLSHREIEMKQHTVTKAMWTVEYELQEPSAEARAFDPGSVNSMFLRALGDVDGRPGDYFEWEEPVAHGRFATGADWARKRHWTVIVTVRADTRPMRVVAYERLGRRPWPKMVERLSKRIKRYGGRAMHDATGLGDVVGDYISNRGVESVIMVGRKREDLLSEYIKTVERGEIVSPHIRHVRSEHMNAKAQDIYGSGHPPDSVVAYALACKAARTYRTGRTQVGSVDYLGRGA